MLTPDLQRRAARIRLLTCDVDGVLTDGAIHIDDEGRETKAFNAQDGLGIERLLAAGVAVAWITGSAAPAVEHRARRLHVPHVILDCRDKLATGRALAAKLSFAPEECAHVGDDLPDIPLMRAWGFAATVPHAWPEVREAAHYVTSREGGRGAVRELAELILAARAAGASVRAA